MIDIAAINALHARTVGDRLISQTPVAFQQYAFRLYHRGSALIAQPRIAALRWPVDSRFLRQRRDRRRRAAMLRRLLEVECRLQQQSLRKGPPEKLKPK